ncbi:MAG: hypothetical protein AAFQ80_23310 [Cyanobacteria bacterium J06621_8]
MQKPWSFRAIEFLTYFQIVIAFIVSSYGILFLVVREVLTFRQPFFDQMPVLYQAILNYGYSIWYLLMRTFGSIPMNVKAADFIFGTAIILFFEFIVSSLILFVLKTKSLLVIRRTAIMILFFRITSGGAIASLVLPISIIRATSGGVVTSLVLPISIFIFTLCSILAVAFLSLKPDQYLILIATTILTRSIPIALAVNENQIDSSSILLHHSDSPYYIFFSICVLSTIFTNVFLFSNPLQQYIRLRS